ncbi:hypothetical protein MKY48_30715 [Paenibacillus sp. FSL W8-0187]
MTTTIQRGIAFLLLCSLPSVFTDYNESFSAFTLKPPAFDKNRF